MSKKAFKRVCEQRRVFATPIKKTEDGKQFYKLTLKHPNYFG